MGWLQTCRSVTAQRMHDIADLSEGRFGRFQNILQSLSGRLIFLFDRDQTSVSLDFYKSEGMSKHIVEFAGDKEALLFLGGVKLTQLSFHLRLSLEYFPIGAGTSEMRRYQQEPVSSDNQNSVGASSIVKVQRIIQVPHHG